MVGTVSRLCGAIGWGFHPGDSHTMRRFSSQRRWSRALHGAMRRRQRAMGDADCTGYSCTLPHARGAHRLCADRLPCSATLWSSELASATTATTAATIAAAIATSIATSASAPATVAAPYAIGVLSRAAATATAAAIAAATTTPPPAPSTYEHVAPLATTLPCATSRAAASPASARRDAIEQLRCQ